VDVTDCSLQKSTAMTMKEWHRYFDGSDRASILNVTALEFSSTRLDTQVTPPRIVRQIDWIDKAWPRHLKDLQLEATNNFEDMMYPKVKSLT
jgi:F-box/leucine-rich repeat protein 10/11